MEAVPERKAARQQSGETIRGNDATQLISSSLEEKFKSLDKARKEMSDENTKPKIQKIPFMLRDNDNFKKYLEPRMVSIGPFHAKNSNLQVTKWMKLKLAALFIEDSGIGRNELYERIMEKIADFKGCYTDEATEGYNNEELAWMFLVDGCALLHYMIICAFHKERRDSKFKRLKIKKDQMAFFRQDVFLLDNQLPYELLELLMGLKNKKYTEEELKKSIKKFILDFINAPTDLYEANRKNYPEKHQPHHLLDLLRTTLIQPDDEKEASHATISMRERSLRLKNLNEVLSYKNKYVWYSSFRNIEELKAAGISLKPSQTSSMISITFSSGTLNIPPIIVDDSTEAKLLNMAAYEMCLDFQNDFEVSAYIIIMDLLIDRARDVKALRECGILRNELGSDEDVADLFNRMSKDLVQNPMYADIQRGIQRHCEEHKLKLWIDKSIAEFIDRYFRSPWSVIAFIAALLALALTVVQTVYTVEAYNKCP